MIIIPKNILLKELELKNRCLSGWRIKNDEEYFLDMKINLEQKKSKEEVILKFGYLVKELLRIFFFLVILVISLISNAQVHFEEFSKDTSISTTHTIDSLITTDSLKFIEMKNEIDFIIDSLLLYEKLAELNFSNNVFPFKYCKFRIDTCDRSFFSRLLRPNYNLYSIQPHILDPFYSGHYKLRIYLYLIKKSNQFEDKKNQSDLAKRIQLIIPNKHVYEKHIKELKLLIFSNIALNLLDYLSEKSNLTLEENLNYNEFLMEDLNSIEFKDYVQRILAKKSVINKIASHSSKLIFHSHDPPVGGIQIDNVSINTERFNNEQKRLYVQLQNKEKEALKVLYRIVEVLSNENKLLEVTIEYYLLRERRENLQNIEQVLYYRTRFLEACKNKLNNHAKN